MESAAESTVRPLVSIRPAAGWQAVDLRELWQFRDLLVTLAARDVKLRYRQTALGAVWVVLQPLMGAGVFSFVFGRVAKLPSDGVPYFVFSYAGLLAWNVFNATFGKASGSLVGNAHLVSKVYFPRLVLPLSAISSTLVDLCVAGVMLGVLMAINGLAPGWGLLLLPVWIAMLLALSLGLALIAGSLMVSYRDVGYVIPVMTQLLLYASPIAYSATAVPAHLRAVYYLNPLSSLVEAFRWSLFGTGTIHAGYVAYSALFSLLLFWGGALTFRRMEWRFADVI